jgi:GH35 family endo-1,4-beta-xylanase
MIQLSQPLMSPVAEGDRVRISFRARSASGNLLCVVIQRRGPPYDLVTETREKISPEWREYSAESEADQAYESGGLAARLQCGYQSGVIEFAAIRVENLGPDPKAAAALAALEPAAVDARILKIRTGDMRVVVRGAGGKPVPGADVRVEMTRSDFLFGCGIFQLDPHNTGPLQIAYQKEFTDLFNYATLPFYWGSFEPERGKPQYERLDAMARWCRDHGIELKGHPLVWHLTWPKWAPAGADEAVPLLRARVFAIIQHYGGLVNYWDVLNEANDAMDSADRVGEGAWITRDGAPAVVATALAWAREAGGANKTTLLYNDTDFNSSEDNAQLLRQLQERNALPDAIGIQSHMHTHTWPLRRVWQICERFAIFDRPIHFTEVTVVSSTKQVTKSKAQPGEWPTTPEGEAAQAEYVEKFYSLLFSHPSVQAITWWEFSDRYASNVPAGLVREDMSPKPAYEKLRALIRGKWWTNAGGKTDSSGTFSVRAFRGDYRIIVATPDGRRVETTAHFSSATREPIEVNLQ